MVETSTPIKENVKEKKDFKVIPVLQATRDRMKFKMMKTDTYDSYLNAKLDRLEELEKIVADNLTSKTG